MQGVPLISLISADPRRSLGSEKHPTSRLKSNEKKGGPGSPSLQAHLGLSYLSTDAHNPPQPHKPSSPENKSGSPALGPRPKPHELSYPISWQTPVAPFVCHKAESWIWSRSLARSVQLHDVDRDHLLHVELLRRLVWNDPPSLVQEAQLAQVELLPLAVRVLQETQGQPPLHLEVHVRTGLVPDSKLQAWPMKERKKKKRRNRAGCFGVARRGLWQSSFRGVSGSPSRGATVCPSVVPRSSRTMTLARFAGRSPRAVGVVVDVPEYTRE